MGFLPYDPGPLPTKPSPKRGTSISFAIEGEPPIKDVSRSIRNAKHPRHSAFLALRRAAIAAMGGRAWYTGPIGMSLTIHVLRESKRKRLVDYVGGVMDTLDGSSGVTFTYLPIIFEDDCQVCTGTSKFIDSDEWSYSLTIEFL